MACSSSCATKDHETFGECMRAKNVQIDRYSLTQNGQPLEKRKWQTLNRFENCVKAGLTPEAPLKTHVEMAERKLESA